MKKAELQFSRKPGKISIDNFEEISEYVREAVKPHIRDDYGENTSKNSYSKKALLKLRSELESQMKEPLNVYNAPLEQVRFSMMKLFAIIDAPLALIEKSEQKCKAKKKNNILELICNFFRANCELLGEYADCVIESPAFIDAKWLEASSLNMSIKHAIIEKINRVAMDISSIETTTNSLAPVLLAKYFETLSIDDTIKFRENIVKAANSKLSGVIRQSDDSGASTEIVINCAEDTFLRTLDQLKLMNVDFHIKSSPYVSALKEIKTPDFDTFVALDIETTGSYGAASGDMPAQITEIGAVKVENGVVTDRFSMLANPKRHITEHVVKLTHITDSMVADKPPVEEVVKKFIEFAGDNILVGHSIKTSDLPFICREAARAGLEFTNPYFDTCDYAASLKEKYGWQKIKLEYLSELFGVKQEKAHRASNDAEANVGVYFALKSLRTN